MVIDVDIKVEIGFGIKNRPKSLLVKYCKETDRLLYGLLFIVDVLNITLPMYNFNTLLIILTACFI